VVCDIRSLCSSPWFHVLVFFMDSDMLADRALPVLTAEAGERSRETGEDLECLFASQ
jgi:hypothetical protein